MRRGSGFAFGVLPSSSSNISASDMAFTRSSASRYPFSQKAVPPTRFRNAGGTGFGFRAVDPKPGLAAALGEEVSWVI